MALLWATPSLAGPERVVSINMCTDQLALDLAAPGQLISVTTFSQDPANSPPHAQAAALHGNRAQAEEVYLLRPDLVLAGTFTSPDTVAMLRNLGIEVAVFAPANALEDIPKRMIALGRALGREAEAMAAAQHFRRDLQALRQGESPRPRAALTYVNAYSAGEQTLAGDIVKAAGFDNVASEIGLSHHGVLRLEELILLAPDVIILGQDYPGAARAETILTHPALRALGRTQVMANLITRDWACGTPRALDAVRALRRVRQSLQAQP